ncbi:Uncharacterised protein [uncultured Clostridium sp.]|uniref:DUF4179 domain-containing protein n=1 Tax=Muricoprocola aceti TaxID=2981772 RepID=A0ABT2SHZ1_9FIRM|nr:DUF4179 domain-containing protein [Muricoprocola aceti]MCU6723905.1 DUF4179 domain-containing protein [Muricoprocola aceti]SCG93358.1 Uncharacterised protein [uncultured Clostridium sp.]
MKKNDTIYTLQQNIEIPDIVTEKANMAFEQIRKDAGSSDKIVTYQKPVKKSRKKYMVAALIATLTVGAVSAYAAYTNWSHGMKEELRISEEQQKNLEANGMAAFSDASVTDAGVTVTAQQSITDNYYTYLSFKVEGYSVEKGVQPDFETISVTVDGQDVSWGGRFYDGMISGNDGMVVNAYGSAPETEADGSMIENYVMDDGSLEYHMILKSHEKGFFTGKQLHVELENLGTVAKAQYFPDIEGNWILDMTLGGADTAKYIETNEKLGDTETIVTGVELSPVSMRITYDFPKTEPRMEEFEDENGEIQTVAWPAQPPFAFGIRLKDGTVMKYISAGSESTGYTSEEGQEYVVSFPLDRVIDPDQVETVLFSEYDEENGKQLTYEVPLKAN